MPLHGGVLGDISTMRWFWSIFGVLSKPPDVRTDGHAPTLDAAKEELAESWRKWLAWAELSEEAGGEG